MQSGIRYIVILVKSKLSKYRYILRYSMNKLVPKHIAKVLNLAEIINRNKDFKNNVGLVYLAIVIDLVSKSRLCLNCR